MNKTLAYSIVGIIVVAGIVAFIAKGPKTIVKNSGDTGTNTETPVETTKSQKSIKELLASNSPTQCTFRIKVDNSESTGSVFIADNKMRGEFSSTTSGKTYSSRLIIDNGIMYSWMDGQKTGVKLAVNGKGQIGGNNIDANTKLDSECQPWTINTSIFLLPAGITFTDLNAMLNVQGGIPKLK